MHCFGIPRQTQSMITCKILTEYFWEKLYCGNVVNMAYFTNIFSLHTDNKGYGSANSSPLLQIDNHLGWLIWLNKIFYPRTTPEHMYFSNNYTSLCLIMIMDAWNLNVCYHYGTYRRNYKLVANKTFPCTGMLPLLREDASKESEQDEVIWRVGDFWTNFTPCSGD